MDNVNSDIQPVTINEIRDVKYQSSNKIDINININPNNNVANELSNNVAPIIHQKVIYLCNQDNTKPVSAKSVLDKKKLQPSKRLASDQIDYKPVFS